MKKRLYISTFAAFFFVFGNLTAQYFNIEKYVLEHLPLLKKELNTIREVSNYQALSDSALLAKMFVPPIDSANNEDWAQYYLSRSLNEFFCRKYKMALEYSMLAHRRASRSDLNRYTELALLEQVSVFFHLNFYKNALSLEQNSMGGAVTNYQMRYMLASSALQSGDYEKCAQLCNKMLSSNIIKNYDVVQVLKLLAESKERKSDYAAALETMQRADKLNQELQQGSFEASTISSLFYRSLNNANFASKMQLEYVNISNKIGILLLKINDYQKAETVFLKLLAFVKEKKLNNYEFQIEKNIGQTYTLLKQYDKADFYYHEAEILSAKEGDQQLQADILCQRAKVRFLMKDLAKATELCKASVDLAAVNNNFGQLTQGYEILAEMHAYQGDIQKTIYYSDLAQENSDRMKNYILMGDPERIGTVMKEEASYDALVKEKSDLERKQLIMEARNHYQELVILKNENAIKEVNLKAQKLEGEKALHDLLEVRRQLEAKNKEDELKELKKDKFITDVFNRNNQTKIRMLNQQRKLDSEIKIQKEKAVQQARAKERNLRIFLVIALIVLAVIVYLLYWNIKNVRVIRLSHKKLEELTENLQVTNRTLNETLVELEQKTEIIKQKNEEILSSIDYAKRIQVASLQKPEDMSKLSNGSFVVFKPRDIISGDFYVVSEPAIADGRDWSVYIVGDCTGHGVPGAMLSLLCSNIVRECIWQNTSLSPAELLDNVNKKLKKFFRNTGEDNSFKDGMDIACCVLDRKQNKLYFAGAGRPLWYIEQGVMTELKGQRYHIGLSSENSNFSNQELDVNPGGIIYLFSDGYGDQFSQKHAKRFMTQNLKKHLVDIHQQPMKVQEEILDRVFEEWRDDTQQTDDVCVLGVKI